MKDEYDFSSAERGKFYVPGATIVAPEYLDALLKVGIEQACADSRPAVPLAEAFTVVRDAERLPIDRDHA